jgi:ABC-type nitrate/sulfonate/bicarbonate transport system substrate-binding protein
MYQTKIKTVGVFIVIATLFLYGCDGDEPPQEDKKVTITIGYLPIIAHLPGAVAETEEMFEGMSVKFRVYGSSDDLLAALVRKDVHFATTIAVAPLLKIPNKDPFPVQIVSYSVTTNKNPFDGIFVRKNSPLQNLNDLEGKRVGVFPGTTASGILKSVLANKFGVTVDCVPLPPNAQLHALENGDIDALFTYETVRTRAILNGMRSVHGSIVAEFLPGAPYGCSAINRQFADQHPELAAKLIQAFDRGIIFVDSKPQEARVVLEAKMGIAAKVAQNCNLETRLTSSEITIDENKKRFIKYCDLLRAAGIVSKIPNIQDVLWLPKTTKVPINEKEKIGG